MTRNQFLQRAILAQLGPETRGFFSITLLPDGGTRVENPGYCEFARQVAEGFADALEAGGIPFDKEAPIDIGAAISDVYSALRDIEASLDRLDETIERSR